MGTTIAGLEGVIAGESEITVADTKRSPAFGDCRPYHGSNSGINPRSIASAGYNRDVLHVSISPSTWSLNSEKVAVIQVTFT